MFKTDFLFFKKITNLDGWDFDKHVVNVFPNMIERSIPGYLNIISIIIHFTNYFAQPNTFIYDLGCSLGKVSIAIDEHLQIKNCKIIAVDNSPDMIKYFRCFLKNSNKFQRIKIIQNDICEINIKNASVIILNFTLQFILPEKKIILLKNIFDGLNPGGILILSEKFSFLDQKIQKILFDMHTKFKFFNNYSKLEIKQKRKMLKSILTTDTIETHKKRLFSVGFKHVELYYQNLNFGSLIAIKKI